MLDDLAGSPDHYLHSFERDDAIIVPMDRAAYARSIFLDDRISPAAGGAMRVPAAALTPPAPRRTGWIFHVAHCGSTLLARGLDRADGPLVLREPLTLRQLGVACDDARLRLAVTMLGRRYDAAPATIVKANVPVNFILPELMALDRAAPAILLHYALDDYCLAILRSGNHRAWLGRVSAELAAHLEPAADDATRAASLWLAQMRAFADVIDTCPNAAALDAERLFADPARVLAAAAAHLGSPMAAGEAESVAAGPVFATYSKNPGVAFDEAARAARRDALKAELAPEIARARDWVAARDRGPALGRSLI